MRIDIGNRYRDAVTGYEGTATGVSTFLTGCVQVLLEAPAAESGETRSQWFDVDRLVDLGPNEQVVEQFELTKEGEPLRLADAGTVEASERDAVADLGQVEREGTGTVPRPGEVATEKRRRVGGPRHTPPPR